MFFAIFPAFTFYWRVDRRAFGVVAFMRLDMAERGQPEARTETIEQRRQAARRRLKITPSPPSGERVGVRGRDGKHRSSPPHPSLSPRRGRGFLSSGGRGFVGSGRECGLSG